MAGAEPFGQLLVLESATGRQRALQQEALSLIAFGVHVPQRGVTRKRLVGVISLGRYHRALHR
jgi:hypothetical protein